MGFDGMERHTLTCGCFARSLYQHTEELSRQEDDKNIADKVTCKINEMRNEKNKNT